MEILLFGITKDIVGTHSLHLDSADIHTVSDLKEWFLKKYPSMKGLGSLAVAVNNQFADDGDHIQASDELALIPPVSGG
ncbi:MAG TPA: MoaD/ThiS family protein [Balneolales bacterium]|nr:MoaD/ThiS family protein [Balneolales bacterium]